jgi:methyl-accepting chemotaxis protein
MDVVTQQNSALVEENAATAKTLEHQAKAMDERVAFFRIAAGAEEAWSEPPIARPATGADAVATRVSAPKPVVAARSGVKVSAPKPVAVVAKAGRGAGNGRAKDAAAVGGGPVARMQAAIADAMIDPEWKEF